MEKIIGYVFSKKMRWTENFTPPTEPYKKLMTNFDETDSCLYNDAQREKNIVPPTVSFLKMDEKDSHFSGGDFMSLPDSDDWHFSNQDFQYKNGEII